MELFGALSPVEPSDGVAADRHVGDQLRSAGFENALGDLSSEVPTYSDAGEPGAYHIELPVQIFGSDFQVSQTVLCGGTC